MKKSTFKKFQDLGFVKTGEDELENKDFDLKVFVKPFRYTADGKIFYEYSYTQKDLKGGTYNEDDFIKWMKSRILLKKCEKMNINIQVDPSRNFKSDVLFSFQKESEKDFLSDATLESISKLNDESLTAIIHGIDCVQQVVLNAIKIRNSRVNEGIKMSEQSNSSTIQTIKCYVVQSNPVHEGGGWNDEGYFHWSDLSDEETKKQAFDNKSELEANYPAEEFRVILREEFETVLS